MVRLKALRRHLKSSHIASARADAAVLSRKRTITVSIEEWWMTQGALPPLYAPKLKEGSDA
jgi:hypothetical protein